MKSNTRLIIFNCLFFILCTILLACNTSKPRQDTIAESGAAPPHIYGKCFALCFIQDEYSIAKDSTPIYSNIDNVEYFTDTIQINSGSEKWVKKKADKSCLNADPEDCYLWCLVETPNQYKIVKTPIDPANAGELSYKIIEIKRLIKKGGFTEWREVVCSDNISIDLVNRVWNALLIKGYDVGKGGANNIFDKKTKAALVKYQRDNNLPVGQLDFETLKALGIK